MAGGDPGGVVRTSSDFDYFMAQLEREVNRQGMYFDLTMAMGQKQAI